VNKDNYETPLYGACRNGNKTIVKYLVELGTNVNKTNKRNKTPLFNACENGNEVIVRYLVENGAEVNKKTKYDKTPLSI